MSEGVKEIGWTDAKTTGLDRKWSERAVIEGEWGHWKGKGNNISYTRPGLAEEKQSAGARWKVLSSSLCKVVLLSGKD